MVNGGTFPIVKINNEIFEECYLEDEMYARIKACNFIESDVDSEGNTDLIYEFKMDFSEFENDNMNKERSGWLNPLTKEFNLTATEGGYKPKNCIENVIHSITHGTIFFELAENNEVLNEYLKTKTNETYVKWLENKYIQHKKLIDGENKK